MNCNGANNVVDYVNFIDLGHWPVSSNDNDELSR